LHYILVTMAVVMFGLQFFCNQQYEREVGNNMAASTVLIFGSNILGTIVLWASNGFYLSCTVFTFVLAMVTAANGVLCTVCSLKSLGRINLALYSLFSMLGGMVLPFVAGIVFYGEELSFGKILCLVFVFAALLATSEPKSEKKEENKGGIPFYVGIFIFNGLSGVLSKIYQSSIYVKADETSYSIWSGLLAAMFAGLIWLCLKEKRIPLSSRSILNMTGSGVLNKVANLLLLFSLAQLPASVQYPMVTGGVIIVSTLFSYFTPKKPQKRDWLACSLAFAAILLVALF